MKPMRLLSMLVAILLVSAWLPGHAESPASSAAPSEPDRTQPDDVEPLQDEQQAPEASASDADQPQEEITASSEDEQPEQSIVGDSLRRDGDASLSELAQQIQAFEQDQAKLVLEARVAQIERATHRYHADLIEPLTLLGDAHMQAQEYEKAVDLYARAVHIDRVSNGLHTPNQVHVVYKEAQALMKLGNLPEANNRYEYAYELQLRRFEPGDEALLEPTYQLADWYMTSGNILPARVLYQNAVDILEQNGRGEHPDAIRPLRAIAQTYKLQRFPPIYLRRTDTGESPFSFSESDDEITPSLDAGARTIAQFPRGERALASVVKILDADPASDPVAQANAYLDLADWYLLFDHQRRYEPLYAHVYEMLGEAAQARFAEPHLLYYPRPADPRAPSEAKRGEAAQGKVTLGFRVSQAGEVEDLTTLAAEPDESMVFRVRRSMRIARFRPRLEDGVPVEASGQRFEHVYTYYLDKGEVTEALQASAPNADAVPEKAP